MSDKNNFLDFLEENIFIKSKKYYTIDINVFKKLKTVNKDRLENFIKEITPFYKNSKKFYLTRDLTYTNFLTLVRQTCKRLNIIYSSKIFYDKSKHNIIYFIYK